MKVKVVRAFVGRTGRHNAYDDVEGIESAEAVHRIRPWSRREVGGLHAVDVSVEKLFGQRLKSVGGPVN